MNLNEWNSLNSQQQDMWFLNISKVEEAILHINQKIFSKIEELSLELDQMDQERDESMDSSAEQPLYEIKTQLYETNRNYLTVLYALSSKLTEYCNDMTEVFQVKDLNRKIYLDYLGLDEWIKKIEEDLGVDSKQINDIINDSGAFKRWESQKDSEFSDRCDFNDGGSGFLGSDRAEELKYEEAKKIYETARYELQSELKFQEELDYIIKSVSKTKGIKDIENAFALEEIIEMLGEYQRKMVKVDLTNFMIDAPKNMLINSLDPNVLDMLKKLKKDGKLVIRVGDLSDSMIKDLKNNKFLKAMDKSGFFKIKNENGLYIISKGYDNFGSWAESNPDKVSALLEEAMKNGVKGIYVQDPDSGRWNTLDENGNKTTYDDLPEGIGNSLDGLNKYLKPFGIVVNTGIMLDSITSGDLSEITGAAGGIIGGEIGADIGAGLAVGIADTIPFDSPFVVAGFVIFGAISGGKAGGELGHEFGEDLGELLESGIAHWE